MLSLEQVGRGQVGARGQFQRQPRRRQLDRLAVLGQQPLPHERPAPRVPAPSKAVTCGGASFTPACTSSPDSSASGSSSTPWAGRVRSASASAGRPAHEAALALLGVDPPVLAQRRTAP